MFLALALVGGAELRAEPVINEFMASNKTTLTDEDGAYSDWIELYNPDATAVSLAGWSLTDSTSNRKKWQFPDVTLAPGGYLVVFASNKNRRDPAGRLHTNFALSASGEYLGLVKPDGTVASEIAPQFPAQADDVSFGYPGNVSPQTGSPTFLAKPTPGAANADAAAARLAETVSFSRAAGPFRNSFTLQLSGADAEHRIRYVVTPANAAATAASPTASSSEYAGPITIDGSTLVRAAVFSADGTVHGPIAEAYYARLSPALGSFTSQLPVVVIDSLGSGPLQKDDVDHPAWLYSYAARGGSPTFTGAPQLVSSLTTSVRGSSSADFPKKGYNVKLTDSAGNPQAQPLADLPAFDKWALVAPWAFDFTYINNAFTYALSNNMGRWAARTRLVEVFFNANGGDIDTSDYAGIYVVTDRVEVGKGRIDIAQLKSTDVTGDAVTGGYILKIDAKGPTDIGWITTHNIPENGISSVLLVSPKADEVAPAQVDYIRNYVQQMEDALFADKEAGFAQRTYLDYIDRDSWVDHHILNTFVCNPDAFTRSAYFTKDRNGKLAAGPVWDFDRALGSYWDERSFRYDVWTGVGGPDFWRIGWWGVLAQDPEFMQDWIDRWQSLRRAEFSNSSLLALVEAMSSQVGTDAANRDGARWPDDVSPYGSYNAQIDHLKGWVTLRAEWIDGQFLLPPKFSSSGGMLTFVVPAGAQLAYTLDGSDPRSLGGEIAPNATLTSTNLTVPASSNVHVRSYKASLRGVFPGSPWSSAVGGDSSSPLSPRARLVNISTRALVGTGENALIAGVVVADTASKHYLSRAVGPGLTAFGATDVVPDPQLSIFAGNGVELSRNNSWESGHDASRLPSYAKAVGAFPLSPGSKDSALASNFSSGAYTLQVTTPTDQNGVGLAELYELDNNGRTVNLSTRARVRTGDGVLIGGFVVQGPAYKRMLIRAVGPTLQGFGLSGALSDPVLTIYSGNRIVAANDAWESADNVAALTAATKAVGAFSLSSHSEDAALLITLPPGAYTVEVKGKGETEGVALLEIYEVP